MEKESYSVDDILSEVKKRREDRDKDLHPNEEIKNPETENIPEETEEPPIEEPSAEEEQVEPEPQEIPEEEPQAEPEPEIIIEEEKPKADENGFVDILAFAPEISEESEYKEEPVREKFFKTKKGKIVKGIIIVLVILIVTAAVAGGIHLYKLISNMTDDKPATEERQDEWTGMDTLIENFPEIHETEASQLSSLKDMIRTWYYNGAPSSSSHTLNVLFIGEDTRGEEILEEDTRADSAIIVSVNIDTRQITLTSVLRDTYAYWENTPGDESTGEFGKINAAMLGGVDTYINAVERLYKIDIDNYVIVNFDSFEKIIDALGGITLELTSAEINEINNPKDSYGNPKPWRYGGVTIEKTFEGDSGEIKLTGEQALAYCRIRYIDSDNARADRQKTCLMQIFEDVQDSSTVTLIKVVNALLPYVNTGFSNSQVLSIAKYALSQGWLGYEVKTTNVPFARINERGAGGEYYGAWCWKADFPQDAHYLQTLIYGKSPIILAQERVDILRCNEYGFYNETLVPCYAVIYNERYGEATTYEAPAEEEESTTASN